MIKESLKIHGHNQFEIKQSYSLSLDKKSNSYYVQTYLFIPNSLNINNTTYKGEDFYNDLNTHIRLKTPNVLLKILSEDSSFFDRIISSINDLGATINKDTIANYKYHIKMFCLILKKSMKVQLKFIKKTNSASDTAQLSSQFIESADRAASCFRNCRQKLISSSIPEDLQAIYYYTDEYMSQKVESHAYRLLEILSGKKEPVSEEINNAIIALIQREREHRIERGYPSIPSETGGNEEFIFRQSVLKKLVNNVLYLETRTEWKGKYLEQILYSLAAGIAMIFATAVAFIGQTWYGSLTLPFFIALVIGYMFKDRIKELMRIYFNITLHKWLYDRSRNIYYSFSEKIGFCKESFHYIDEKKLPWKILEIRNRDQLTDIENSRIGEKIILYRKYIKLNSKKFKKIRQRYPTDGIIDIVRYNIERYLKNMDYPEKKIYMPGDNGFKIIYGMRVYHMNLVTHFVIDSIDFLKKFRIVLTQMGIQRIEEVHHNID